MSMFKLYLKNKMYLNYKEEEEEEEEETIITESKI